MASWKDSKHDILIKVFGKYLFPLGKKVIFPPFHPPEFEPSKYQNMGKDWKNVTDLVEPNIAIGSDDGRTYCHACCVQLKCSRGKLFNSYFLQRSIFWVKFISIT